MHISCCLFERTVPSICLQSVPNVLKSALFQADSIEAWTPIQGSYEHVCSCIETFCFLKYITILLTHMDPMYWMVVLQNATKATMALSIVCGFLQVESHMHQAQRMELFGFGAQCQAQMSLKWAVLAMVMWSRLGLVLMRLWGKWRVSTLHRRMGLIHEEGFHLCVRGSPTLL